VGVEYVFTELKYTINADAYVAGDEYEFYTYRYFGSVELAEQSVPIAFDTDIEVLAEGGI